MQRLRLGFAFTDGCGTERQRVAFLPVGEGDFLLFFTIHPAPSGFPDDAAFDCELHSGTFRRNGGYVLDAFFGECLNHASGNHVVHCCILFREEQRLFARDEQGVMVRHLIAIHTAAYRLGFRLHLVFPFGLRTDEGKQSRNFSEHVVGNVAASRSRIRNEFLLVELLRDAERLLRREPVFGVGFFLECGQVVQKRGFLRLLPAFGFCDGGGTCSLYLII